MQIKIDTLTKGTREIVLPGSTLKAYLICRDESNGKNEGTRPWLKDDIFRRALHCV